MGLSASKNKKEPTRTVRVTKQTKPNSILAKRLKSKGKWARFVEVAYADHNKTLRNWECVERTTRAKHGVDGVFIIAQLNKADGNYLVLVSQYRPPVNKWTLEFPAGLVEESESPKTAATRELLEETGYEGIASTSFPVACLDPGLSNANIMHVKVDIDGSAEANKNPKNSPNAEEGVIKVHLLPMSALEESIMNLAKEESLMVNSSLLAFATGFSMTSKA